MNWVEKEQWKILQDVDGNRLISIVQATENSSWMIYNSDPFSFLFPRFVQHYDPEALKNLIDLSVYNWMRSNISG